MGRKQKFIEKLIDVERSTLEEAIKNSPRSDFRKRCEIILLSYKGFTTDQIKQITDLGSLTIYKNLNKWREHGISGLLRQKGQGRKAQLDINNAEHVKLVEQKVASNSQKIADLIPEIVEELQIGSFSKWTLKRFLKNLTTPGSDFERN